MSQAKQPVTSAHAHPPVWIRFLFVPVGALLVYDVAGRRGWVLGAVAVIVFGALAVSSILRPRALIEWSRTHPRADGASLGPIVFLALAGLTPLAVSWCLVGGALALLAGIAMGARRGRLAARQGVVAEAEVVDAENSP